MAITRIGTSSVEATSITLPGSPQPGDLMIIFAFRTALVAPTLPTGWTSLNTASAGASSQTTGYRIFVTGDTSSTWTNATGLVCMIYRGTSTSQTPVVASGNSTATSANVTYTTIASVTGQNNWVVAMAATKTTTSTLETPPTNLTNETDTVGAATEYAGHDSNGGFTAGNGTWPTTAVAVGTSAEWRAVTLQVFAESLGYMANDFQALKAEDNGNGVLSFGERIR